jgi:hypothetical protein
VQRGRVGAVTLGAPYAALLLSLAFLPACSLDDRTLALGRTPSFDAGGPLTGQVLPRADTAHRDANGVPAFADGGARVSDGGVWVSDSAATESADDEIVVEAAFDGDTQPWEGERGMTLTWMRNDAKGAASSGSASVSNENAGSGNMWVFGAVQRCVPALGEAVYALFGSVFIEGDQGRGGAGLNISFFSEAECTGRAIAGYDTPPTDKVGAWTTVAGEARSPADTTSLRIRLVVPKPLEEPSFAAEFDDVRVTRPR